MSSFNALIIVDVRLFLMMVWFRMVECQKGMFVLQRSSFQLNIIDTIIYLCVWLCRLYKAPPFKGQQQQHQNSGLCLVGIKENSLNRKCLSIKKFIIQPFFFFSSIVSGKVDFPKLFLLKQLLQSLVVVVAAEATGFFCS